VLTANLETRTIEGLVLPFGEVGHTNKGAVLASAESRLAFGEPITLNRQHDGETFTVGRATHHEVREDGVHATFTVDEGPHGDVVLLEAAEDRKGLSVEIPDAVIRAGKLLAGTIKAVGAVLKPAFPSALMAADAGDLPPDTEVIQPPDQIQVGDVTYTRAAPDTEENDDMTEPTVEGAENATVDLSAAFGDFLKTQTKAKELTAAQAFRAIAKKNSETGDLLAALASVTHDDGDNDGDGVGEITGAPGWLGEVWSENPYVQRFKPLIASGALNTYKEVGFRVTGKPTVADYAGNLAEVPTGGMTVEPVTYSVSRLAHGANVDRRYIDFNDSQALQAFVEAQVQSYAEVIDAKVLAFILAQADAETAGDFVAGVQPGIAGIVDGALALIADNFRPTAAIVGADLYRSILLTPKDQVAEYLTQAFGLEEGGLSGFRIVPTAAAGQAGKVTVLDGSTLRVKELPGATPVRVEAEYASNGGRTLAVFGYYSLQNLKDGGARTVTPLTAAPEEGGGE
jgi:hypothetical protein